MVESPLGTVSVCRPGLGSRCFTSAWDPTPSLSPLPSLVRGPGHLGPGCRRRLTVPAKSGNDLTRTGSKESLSGVTMYFYRLFSGTGWMSYFCPPRVVLDS